MTDVEWFFCAIGDVTGDPVGWEGRTRAAEQFDDVCGRCDAVVGEGHSVHRAPCAGSASPGFAVGNAPAAAAEPVEPA